MSSIRDNDSLMNDYIGLVRDQQRILEYVTLNLGRISDNLTGLVTAHIARTSRTPTTFLNPGGLARTTGRRVEIQPRSRTLRRRVPRLGETSGEGSTSRPRLAPRPPPGPPPAPPTGLPGPVGNIVTSFDSPVRIRPSARQVRVGTRLLRFGELSDDPNAQTTCPIDRNAFEADDSILQIRHCGHIFREMNLRRHFRRSPRCPLCRYDIRDYAPPSDAASPETAPADTAGAEERASADVSSQTLLRTTAHTGSFPTLNSSLLGTVLSDALNNFPTDSSDNTVDIRYSVYVPHI